ncbi:hypothetical protein CEE37_05925 [candidate division LCP-89 bacterium B3_LCP]|uniref:Uncharacterized protein n=1 Tax=candidate division LCP-89 bacterium B3_LCP TaxID=2012998 RepID=A0A532V1W0_UNCL8|nr:MAG: hypothetical protein CEE37_05925 [candidate division LCP-89 bacterium B3_LCP]
MSCHDFYEYMRRAMKKVIVSVTVLSVLLSLTGISIGQTVIATYEIHDHASGLAYDGQNIWYGRYGTGGEWIYQFNISLGQVVDSLDIGTANLDDAYGMTWDGQFLWVTNHIGSDFTLQIDTLGNIIYSFPNPSDYMSGLAWNGSELYMSDYYNPDGAIYRVNTAGTILENFTAPDTQPWDLAWDGTTLWMCDYWSDWIYQIDPVSHNVLYSFTSPITEPAGITWDGTYLWVCDEGQGYDIDHLYIIEPFGSGTPEIQLSTSTIDFGFIPLGISPNQTLTINNVGDADLTVTGLPIDQFGGEFWVDPAVTLPFVVVQSSAVDVNIYYSPINFGASSGLLHVQSEDPINPDVTVDLSGYGIYPQQTVGVSSTNINFGSVWVAQGDGMTGRPLEIYNLGVSSLELISLTIDNPAFFADDFQPGSLASMDTTELTIYFMPEAVTPYSGTMTLITDDPSTPIVEITLSGQGVPANFGVGDIIWEFQAEAATFDGFNSLKYTDDVNGDGIPEMLGANDNYNVYCWNGQSAGIADIFYTFDTGWDPLRTGKVEYERGLVSAPDLNGDDIGDFALGTGGGSRSIFAVSGADGAELWHLDTHEFGGEGGWVYEVTCEDDWNNDDVWDVLAAVGGPSGSNEPKSVFLISGVDGSQIWRAHLGETVYSVRRLGDFNYDPYDEVVCGTSPYTGTYYVKMLNGWNGIVIWSTEVDNVVFSLNRIDDVTGDGFPDVAVAAAFGGVYVLDGFNGNVFWHVSGMGTNYYLEVTDDLNGNSYDDILITSVSGTFYALEGLTGAVIWSLPLGSNVLSLAATPDVTGDGIADACCGIMSGTFYAVDGADGSILFSHTHGGGSSYAFDAVGWIPDIDNTGAIEFLGGTRDGHAYCFSGGTVTIPNINVTLTPYNPPIQIPAWGGSFDFNIALENLDPAPAAFDFWIMVELPNGNPFGPVLGPISLNLPGSIYIERDRTQTVPENAPAGFYEYIAYAGVYPGTVWAQDSFQFEKQLWTDGMGQAISDWLNDGEPLEEVFGNTVACDFVVLDCYPNPFNPVTKISYQLPAANHVKLTVYDISGSKITSVVNGWRDAGMHEVTFNGSNLASGVYIYRLKAEEFVASGKMVLMK